MVRRRAFVAIAALVVVVAAGVGVATQPSLFGGRPGSTTAPTPTQLAVLTAAPTATAAPTPTPSPTQPPDISILDRSGIQERLQAMLDRDRATLAAPGLAASVMLADGRSWSGTSGVADLASKRALTVDTPFSIASISKTFLAAEILELVAAGSMRLDDSVAGLLPGVPVGGRQIDPRITIRQLLDHTSGLRDYLVDSKLGLAATAQPRRVWTPAMALAYAGKPLAAPGVGYHYANTNYVLLGLIAQKVTGRTLAQEYRSRFFEPLGMKSAFYQVAEKPTAMLPTSYQYKSSKLDAVPIDVTDGTGVRPFTAITSAAGAAGSIAASAPTWRAGRGLCTAGPSCRRTPSWR